MSFDVEAYRKAAKANNLTNAEIENEIKYQTSVQAKKDPFEKGPNGFELSSLDQIQERLGNDWWHLPAAVTAIGLGIYGASKLMGGGPNNPPNNPPGPRIDPTFDVEPIAQQPMQPVKPQQTNLTPQDLEARAAQLKAPVAPSATPTVAELDAAFAAQNPVSTPITAAPVDAPAPMPSAAPNSPVTSIVTDTVKEMIQEAPAQPVEAVKPVAAAPAPVAAPAYPKTGTKFKTEADIPPGFVARYDVGNLDRSMGNILGLEHRAYARDLFNEGKPFGQSANLNKDVSELTKKYFQQLQGEIPETILGREARQAQKIPSEFGVFSKNTPFGAGVTIGGKAATLFAIPHIANAAQQGNYGSAALQAADIATDYLPFVGQVKQALSPSSAGEGSTLAPSQMQLQQNAMLLGSPYAQSPLAVKRRQEQEYVRKVGAGRGIAPPSAYQR